MFLRHKSGALYNLNAFDIITVERGNVIGSRVNGNGTQHRVTLGEMPIFDEIVTMLEDGNILINDWDAPEEPEDEPVVENDEDGLDASGNPIEDRSNVNEYNDAEEERQPDDAAYDAGFANATEAPSDANAYVPGTHNHSDYQRGHRDGLAHAKQDALDDFKANGPTHVQPNAYDAGYAAFTKQEDSGNVQLNPFFNGTEGSTDWDRGFFAASTEKARADQKAENESVYQRGREDAEEGNTENPYADGSDAATHWWMGFNDYTSENAPEQAPSTVEEDLPITPTNVYSPEQTAHDDDVDTDDDVEEYDAADAEADDADDDLDEEEEEPTSNLAEIIPETPAREAEDDGKSEQYNDGVTAYNEGKTLEDNPNKFATEEHVEWAKGWDAAMVIETDASSEKDEAEAAASTETSEEVDEEKYEFEIEQGWDAFDDEKPIDANPYAKDDSDEGKRKSAAWVKGWREADTGDDETADAETDEYNEGWDAHDENLGLDDNPYADLTDEDGKKKFEEWNMGWNDALTAEGLDDDGEEESAEYTEGYNAQDNGEQLSSNPYSNLYKETTSDEDAGKSADWIRGWKFAQAADFDADEDQESVYYLQGVDAHSDGRDVNDNPHAKGSEKFKDWVRGWQAAENDDED